MDYITRYGMDFNPFIKNSKEIVVETSDYKEVVCRLNYLLNNKGFGILTGGPGRGKTTIIRNWCNSLNSSLYKVIYTSLSTLTVAEFYKNLAMQLGLEPMARKIDNFKIIQNEINRYTVEKRITPIIIIDEANYISNGILNDLKMLFNFDMDSRDRAIVLLVGLPQLNNTMRLAPLLDFLPVFLEKVLFLLRFELFLLAKILLKRLLLQHFCNYQISL